MSVKDDSIVAKGCLIGDRVVIGPGAKLTPFERLSSVAPCNEEDENSAVDEQEEDDSDIEEVESSESAFLFL